MNGRKITVHLFQPVGCDSFSGETAQKSLRQVIHLLGTSGVPVKPQGAIGMMGLRRLGNEEEMPPVLWSRGIDPVLALKKRLYYLYIYKICLYLIVALTMTSVCARISAKKHKTVSPALSLSLSRSCSLCLFLSLRHAAALATSPRVFVSLKGCRAAVPPWK